MINQDTESFVALGRAIESALDEGVLDTSEYSRLAGALAVGILTGTMGMEAYADIHDVLASILDAAFAGTLSDKAMSSPAINELFESGALGAQLEVIGDVWESVGPGDEDLERVGRFFEDGFNLSEARFQTGCWFAAPLRFSPEALAEALKATGLDLINQAVKKECVPHYGMLVEAGAEVPGACFVVGWEGRRTALALTPELPN